MGQGKHEMMREVGLRGTDHTYDTILERAQNVYGIQLQNDPMITQQSEYQEPLL
jgi:hypothetical protein